jgi:hypothetical protein
MSQGEFRDYIFSKSAMGLKTKMHELCIRFKTTIHFDHIIYVENEKKWYAWFTLQPHNVEIKTEVKDAII